MFISFSCIPVSLPFKKYQYPSKPAPVSSPFIFICTFSLYQPFCPSPSIVGSVIVGTLLSYFTVKLAGSDSSFPVLSIIFAYIVFLPTAILSLGIITFLSSLDDTSTSIQLSSTPVVPSNATSPVLLPPWMLLLFTTL